MASLRLVDLVVIRWFTGGFKFVVRLPGDDGLTGAVFAIGDDGRASQVVVEEFDQHGQGTFVRGVEKPNGTVAGPQPGRPALHEPARDEAEGKGTNKVCVEAHAPKTRMVTVEPGVQVEVLDWGGGGPPQVLLTGLGNTAHVYADLAHRF